MVLHPQVVRLLDLMAQAGDPPVWADTPQNSRDRRNSRVRPSNIEVPIVWDLDAGGTRARLYRPAGNTRFGLTVFFHGGGWVLGSMDTHDAAVRALVQASGHSVLSVDYRLAPEDPFPAGLTDAISVTRWAQQHAGEFGCDPDRLAVMGDSAGGNLAAVVAQLAPVPLRFQVLVYPVMDMAMDTASYAEFVDGPLLAKRAMESAAQRARQQPGREGGQAAAGRRLRLRGGHHGRDDGCRGKGSFCLQTFSYSLLST